jgi:hypothetical protein
MFEDPVDAKKQIQKVFKKYRVTALIYLRRDQYASFINTVLVKIYKKLKKDLKDL